jgi:protein-tyrosine phosphatase
VELTRAQRIVFVCKGNICRSPFAAAFAVQAGLPAVSAGTDAEDGMPADAEAARVARQFGIDLATHRATNVAAMTFTADDLVVGFEPSHLAKLAIVPGVAHFQATLLGAWSRYPNLYIHDPYAHSGRYYQACFARIANAVESLNASIGRARLDD